MLKICSIGSGSKGNCILVQSQNTSLLVDMGLSSAKVRAALHFLKIDPASLSACLLTHCHSDHVKGVKSFVSKHPVRVIGTTCAVAAAVGDGYGNFEYLFERDFFIGDITVSPFKVSHDVPCYGFSMYCGGKKISIATDLGVMPDEVVRNISDSDVVMIESNHDVGLVRSNCNYPEYLKRRILSGRGHLSNTACAETCAKLIMGGTRKLILAHLSEENNSPKLAYDTVSGELHKYGLVDGRDYNIYIAGQYNIGEIIEAV